MDERPDEPADDLSGSVDPAGLTPSRRHRLFARLPLPQSVALISTRDADGELLVAPLGYCVPLPGPEALVAVTIAAVRDAGGEPELVRAAALAGGELVANLTTPDLAAHLARVGRVERDPATGLPRWPTAPSRRVAVPGLAGSRARLECRVRRAGVPDAPPGAAGGELAVRTAPVPGAGYVLIAEVVCVVADPELLAADDPAPEPAPPPARGRAEFPWFFGPDDGSVVGSPRRPPGRPAAEPPLVIEQPPA